MNEIVRLMYKYAGWPVGIVKRLSRIAPHGSPLRAGISEFVHSVDSLDARKNRVQTFLYDYLWRPGGTPGTKIHPTWEPSILSRGLSKKLQKRWTPGRADDVASKYVESYRVRGLPAIHRYMRLSRDPMSMGKVIDQYRNNAQGADAVRYFFIQNARNPDQATYFKSLPMKAGPGGPSFGTLTGNVNMGDPRSAGIFHSIGHELGHARYNTKRVPKIVAKSDGEMTSVGNLPYAQRWSAAVGPHSSEALKFWHEVGANQQYDKVMRRALADNPELYARWRRSAELTNFPALATYITNGDNKLPFLVQSLPKSLQPQAKAYVSRYAAFLRRLRKERKRTGLPIWWLNGTLLDRYSRLAQHRDPTLGSDLYRYAISKGMPVDPNAWYNRGDYLQSPLIEEANKEMMSWLPRYAGLRKKMK